MFEYYNTNFKGQLNKEHFNEIVPYAKDTLMAVAKEHVPYWRLAYFNLDEERFYRSMCLQVEFINSIGGVSTLLSGNIPSGITKIETSGFALDYRNTSKNIGGLPVSPLAVNEFLTVLRMGGYMYLGVDR